MFGSFTASYIFSNLLFPEIICIFIKTQKITIKNQTVSNFMVRGNQNGHMGSSRSSFAAALSLRLGKALR